MKGKIFGFLQGFTKAASRLLPARHSRKKTTPHKTVNSRKRPIGRIRTKEKGKTRSVAAGTVRKGSARTTAKPIKPSGDNPNVASPSRTMIYSCPTCGLQAPKTLMFEHLLSSPTHQRGRAEPEQANGPGVNRDPATARHEDVSRDSLRNLLQILLPPRAFGHRHGQKGVTTPAN